MDLNICLLLTVEVSIYLFDLTHMPPTHMSVRKNPMIVFNNKNKNFLIIHFLYELNVLFLYLS